MRKIKLKVTDVSNETEKLEQTIERYDLPDYSYEEWALSAQKDEIVFDYKVMSVSIAEPTEHDREMLPFYKKRISVLKDIYFKRFAAELPSIEIASPSRINRYRELLFVIPIMIALWIPGMLRSFFVTTLFGKQGLITIAVIYWLTIGYIIYLLVLFMRKLKSDSKLKFAIPIVLIMYIFVPAGRIYSVDILKEFKFFYSVTMDVLQAKTQTADLSQVELTKISEEYYLPGGRTSRGRWHEFDHVFLNDIYPIQIGTTYSNDNRYRTIKKANNITVEYYKNSKILKKIIIDGVEYNNFKEIPETQPDPIKSQAPVIVEFAVPSLDLKITEITNKNYGREDTTYYIIDFAGRSFRAVPLSFREMAKQEEYSAFDAGDFFIVGPMENSYGGEIWQCTFELGNNKYIGTLELTNEQKEILKRFPVRTVKRNEL